MKILIVDDNPQNLYLLQTLLSKSGFEVETASNGAEALEKARQAPPDLIVSDILMPVMDGFTLCRIWKKEAQFQGIPFVFYTATYTDPKDEEFALSLGAERFIVKPLEPEKFLALLRETIEAHKAGRLAAARAPIAEEGEYYEQYSAALVRKLEDKILQLEEANRALELDIVARKQAEERASLSEARLGATLYSIGDAVIATDEAGRVTMMNPVAERLTGWGEAEALGRPLEEIFHIVNEETRAPVENPVMRVLREGVVLGLANHTLLIARDGAEYPIADAGAPIRDAAGRIVGVVLVFRDQSAERAAQRAVQQARRLAEGIVETVHEPLVVLDADLRVVSANRAFYHAFQVAAAETEGRPIYELGNRQWDLPELRRLLEEILPQNSHFDNYEVTHEFEHIGRRTMRLNARRLRSEGEKIQLILLAIEDITERKQAEERMQASQAELQRLLAEAERSRRALLSILEDQKQTQEALYKHVNELSALYKAGQRLQSLRTPEQLAEEIVQILEETVGYDYGAVLLIEEGGDRLLPFALSTQGRGPGFARADKRYVTRRARRLGEGITGWVAQTGQSVCLGDVSQDERYYPMRQGIRSELCVPLFVEGKVIGVLNVESTHPNAYDESDQRLLETIAVQIGAAIQNARLYEAVQQELAERKRLERVLQRERDTAQRYLDIAGVLIGAMDRQGRITLINQRGCEILGWTAGELIGRNWFEICLPEEARAEVKRVFEQMMAGEVEPAEYHENAVLTKSGERRILSFHNTVIRDDDSRITGILFSGEDITTRKQAEAALQAAHEAQKRFSERLAILLEVTGELSMAESLDVLCRRVVELGQERLDFDRLSIWFVTPDHTAMLGTFGVDDEGHLVDERGYRLPLDPSVNIWPVVEGQVAFQHLRDTPLFQAGRLVGQGEHVSAGLWDGKTVIGFMSADNFLRRRPFSAYDCEIVRLYASAVGHLCSLKRAQEALRESEERYRMLLELAPVGILVYSQEKIVFINSAGVRLLGAASEEQILGRPISEIVHPAHWEEARERIRRVMAGEGGLYPVEEVYLKLDGAPVDVQVMAAPFLYKGEPAVQVIVSDITERKKAEQEIRHRLMELQVLYETSLELSSRLSLPEIGQKVIDILKERLYWHHAVVRLKKEGSEEVEIIGYARAGEETGDDAAEKERLNRLAGRAGRGLAGWVLKHGKMVRKGNLPSDRRYVATYPNMHSGLYAPMQAGGEVIGVISVESEIPDAFDEHDERLLATLAEITANTIHRARLRQQTERQLQRLSALRAIDQAISASLDLHVTLDIFLRNAAVQLGADAALILLVNPAMNTLEYAESIGFRSDAIRKLRLRLDEGYAGRAVLQRRRISIPELSREDRLLIHPEWVAREGFVAYHAAPLIAKGQVKGVMEVFHRRSIEPTEEWLDFLETLAGQAAIAIDNNQLFENLQRSNLELGIAYDATIEGWSRALDLRDRETEGHTQRVTAMTEQLGRAVGMSEVELAHLRRGALLHDIGKMGIPDSILLKPGELTPEEWEIMRRHPQLAYEMLVPIAYLHPALDIPYCHHEKWDGSGYPRGLKGEAIPLAARLFAVADVYDALTSDRPYRKAWSRKKALAYLREQAGKHFDPQVVEIFLRLIAEGQIA